MDRVALPSSRFAMGEEEVLCRPCPRCSVAARPVFIYWLWWPALPVPVRVLGFPVLVLFSYIFIVCSLYLYYAFPSLNGPVGLCFWTRDMTSDWLPTGLPPRIPGHCRLVLAGSHDSLFLWYPAIDIVWLGPVFLALGSLSHLALRDSARWTLSHGRCGLQSLSRMPSLPLLTLIHDFTILHLWCRLWHQPPMVSLYCLCLYIPSFTTACLWSCTSRHPFQCLKSCYLSVQVTVLLDMLFLK